MKIYPAIVLAGYSPDHPDPLALAMGMQRKSLIELAGKPMVYWIVRALRSSQHVGRIAIVGMGPEDGVDFETDVLYVPNQSGSFENAMAGVKALQSEQPDIDYLLISSSDIPLLQTRTVDWLTSTAEQMDGDFYYTFVEEKIMERQFPGVGRSYVPMMEGRFCGGDLFVARASVARYNEQLIRDLIARRKNAFRQVRMAGFSTVIKFLLRRLSIKDAEQVGSRLLQCRAYALPSPYADIGMDVDKPHQLDIARRYLAGATPT